MTYHRLNAAEKARVLQRVTHEGKVPLKELTELAGCSPNAMIRYIIDGWHGIHLEGISDPYLGWCSSEKAVLRFLRRKRVQKRLEAGGLRRDGRLKTG